MPDEFKDTQKSVSIQALVGGDHRLVDAHDRVTEKLTSLSLPEMQQALSQLQHLASKPEGLANTKLVHTILAEAGYEPKPTLNNSIARVDRLERALKDIGRMVDDELSKSHTVSPQAAKEIQAIVGAALKPPKIEEKNQHTGEQTQTAQRPVSIARM